MWVRKIPPASELLIPLPTAARRTPGGGRPSHLPPPHPAIWPPEHRRRAGLPNLGYHILQHNQAPPRRANRIRGRLLCRLADCYNDLPAVTINVKIEEVQAARPGPYPPG